MKFVQTGGPKAKKRIAAIGCVATGIWRDPRKSIQKLAAEHNMVFNTMKRIFHKDLGMCSKVLQEKPVLTIDVVEKRCKRARKLLLRLMPESCF
jgi:AraC-like DNA-binding protein